MPAKAEKIKEGLTFDDVLLVPAASEIHPKGGENRDDKEGNPNDKETQEGS